MPKSIGIVVLNQLIKPDICNSIVYSTRGRTRHTKGFVLGIYGLELRHQQHHFVRWRLEVSHLRQLRVMELGLFPIEGRLGLQLEGVVCMVQGSTSSFELGESFRHAF